MITTSVSHTPMQALAAQWRVLGMMLVAFARQITLAHKMRAAAGERKAEALEAALFTALVQLSSDITAAALQEEELSADDQSALAYLKTVHALLGVLALMIRQIKVDLAGAAERWAKLNVRVAHVHTQRSSARAYPPSYLDSS